MKLGYIEWINATAIFPLLFSLEIKLFTYMPKSDFYHVKKSEIKICTMAKRLYYKSLLPLIFAPPGQCCVSIVFLAVLAQMIFHRESGP